MKVAISQSNYIPWKGYFDMINRVDKFVYYDDMQYTKRDWRNRNKIKTKDGLKWLTIPVEVKGKYHQKINETAIADGSWAEKHLKTIELNYKKAENFDVFFPEIKSWYAHVGKLELLSDVNHFLIERICEVMDIHTQLIDSRKFKIQGTKSEALVSILDQIEGTTEYFSGPAAKSYIDYDLFSSRNIELKWMDYANYPDYKQLHGDFEHGVTILDLLLNEGANQKYLKIEN